MSSLGLQVVFDGGNPRSFTGKAREVISGGQLVIVSGATFNNVGSTVSQFATSDLGVCLIVGDADGEPEINGIALTTAASGADVTVGTQGAYILQCAGSVLPGKCVEAVSKDTIQSVSSGIVPSALFADIHQNKVLGRAISFGYSGTSPGATFALVNLTNV